MPLASAKESFLETLGSFGVDYRNGSHDRAVAETFPACDPTTEQQPAGEPLSDDAPVVTAAHDGHHRVPVAGDDYELDHGAVVIAAITSCTNTSNPQVMVAAGPARAEGGRARPAAQAVGEVVARAGLAGRHRYYEQAGLQTLPRRARLQHGRLRLHDLHRQLRPARRRDLGGDRRGRPRRLRGALGQPQLRGAHPSRGEGELPRLAAARRRLRARRPDGHRPRDGADRCRGRRRRRVPARPLAERSTRSARRSRRRCAARCSPRPTPTSSPATTPGARSPVPRGELFRWEPGSTYVRQPPYFDGMSREPAPFPDIEGARCLVSLGDSVTTDHISPAGSIRLDSPAGALPRPSTASSAGLQLVRRAARQPRGDGARHVRERPAPQPARPRLGGNVDGARPVGRGDDDLRRVGALPGRGNAARRPRRARSTARARRATGRRRGRTCSACGP